VNDVAVLRVSTLLSHGANEFRDDGSVLGGKGRGGSLPARRHTDNQALRSSGGQITSESRDLYDTETFARALLVVYTKHRNRVTPAVR